MIKVVHRRLITVAAVNTLDPSLNLSFNKMQKYAPGLVVSEVWGKYARSAWN